MESLEYIVYKGSPSGRIVKSTTRRAPLGENEVLVDTTHSGLCGTDEHYKHQDVVLGHEGVGTVRAVGSNVQLFKIGDRVGWGYCHGSCGTCWACDSGKNLYCEKRQLYGFTNLDQGSFSAQAVWSETSLFPVPDELASVHAAPLMCAGAAVYSAIHRANVCPADRIGVLGMGGLGHLAIQFAVKMGCEVVVFSSSGTKRDEALAYGAHEFHIFTETPHGDKQNPVDCMLITSGKAPDWKEVMPWIKRGGTISVMTVDPGDLTLPYMELVMNAIQIQGSLPAPIRMHREMLEFAARHKICPTFEEFPLNEEGVNTAMEKLRKGHMRYRGVLVG